MCKCIFQHNMLSCRSVGCRSGSSKCVWERGNFQWTHTHTERNRKILRTVCFHNITYFHDHIILFTLWLYFLFFLSYNFMLFFLCVSFEFRCVWCVVKCKKDRQGGISIQIHVEEVHKLRVKEIYFLDGGTSMDTILYT